MSTVYYCESCKYWNGKDCEFDMCANADKIACSWYEEGYQK